MEAHPLASNCQLAALRLTSEGIAPSPPASATAAQIGGAQTASDAFDRAQVEAHYQWTGEPGVCFDQPPGANDASCGFGNRSL